MKVKYTVTESEIKRAVIDWLASNSNYCPQDIDITEAKVVLARDSESGEYVATVEATESTEP